MKILIKGGNVIDPANNISEKLDILTDGKVIAAVGKDISAPDAEVINAEGPWFPGLWIFTFTSATPVTNTKRI